MIYFTNNKKGSIDKLPFFIEKLNCPEISCTKLKFIRKDMLINSAKLL